MSEKKSETIVDLCYAESFSTQNLFSKTLNVQITPYWINDEDRFWFKKQTVDGHEFVLVDAATGEQQPIFDHAALAKALTAAGEAQLDANALPISDLRFSSETIDVTLTTKTLPETNLKGLFVEAAMLELSKVSYRFNPKLNQCEAIETKAVNTIPAPTGNKAVYVHDNNLYLRDTHSGEETPLTSDGAPYFAYGAWDEGSQDTSYTVRRRLGKSMRPQWIQWSPDGRYVAAMRLDLREVPERPVLTEFASGIDDFMVTNMRHYPLISDKKDIIRTVTLIDTETKKAITANIDPSRLQDRAPNHFNNNCLWWNLTDNTLYLITASKDACCYGLVAITLTTGKVRTIVEETEELHYIFNGSDVFCSKPDFYVTHDGAEAIWYSQRSGYGHLYLYDAQTGELKNPITQGDWVVCELIRVDEAERRIYFYATGKEPDVNPYYKQLYRVGFDGSKLECLTPEKAHHNFRGSFNSSPRSFSAIFSPSGNYFLDTYSTLSQAPVMVIRKNDGKLINRVIAADISALEATGWQPPESFVVKAADQKTDLYGIMIKPIDFNPEKRYPIVEYTYPGPQGSYAPRGFIEGLKKDLQSIAEMGFIAVYLDGRGTAGRDREFRYTFLATEDPFGAADHKAAIENLAQQHPYMDIKRVGVIGESYGGYGAAHATLLYPEFYKVCVSIVGSHDFRASGNSSVRRLFGIPDIPGKDLYHAISNTRLAHRLQGKLFLIYGELDLHVRLNQYFLMADALVKAGKDFDSLIVPNADHSAGQLPYVKRRWKQYLSEHLKG